MISNEIINVLEYLAQKIGLTIDWTSENVMPYVEQLFEKFIAYEIATSFAWIGIYIFISIVATLFFVGMKKLADRLQDSFLLEVGITVLIFALVFSFMVICFQVFDIIECKIFPEKTIYEYIQMMLNSK